MCVPPLQVRALPRLDRLDGDEVSALDRDLAAMHLEQGGDGGSGGGGGSGVGGSRAGSGSDTARSDRDGVTVDGRPSTAPQLLPMARSSTAPLAPVSPSHADSTGSDRRCPSPRVSVCPSPFVRVCVSCP
jgi:hypothetical protein